MYATAKATNHPTVWIRVKTNPFRKPYIAKSNTATTIIISIIINYNFLFTELYRIKASKNKAYQANGDLHKTHSTTKRVSFQYIYPNS